MPRLRSHFQKARLRAHRQWLYLRTFRKGAELTFVAPPRRHDGVFVFCVVRNERHRLPQFLDHYRQLQVSQFFFVDNASTDGTAAFLQAQPDVALWTTQGSYRLARYGMDWADALKRRYGRGRWCVTVDADELLVYPHHATRPLPALTAWLEQRHRRSFHTLLLDMYTDPLGGAATANSSLDQVAWFDCGNYRAQLDPRYGHDWIQGGARERAFFARCPQRAPALNKVPLVHWSRGYAYISSTHHLLPRGLNRHVEGVPTGVLLHTKLLSDFPQQAHTEVARGQHYQNAAEYRAYLANPLRAAGLMHAGSKRFQGWAQLEDYGLMSRGTWV